jgi:hypothetical protein
MIGITWQQLQEGNMKTPEDEAFEDIERRQGGFPAKQRMAADRFKDGVEWWMDTKTYGAYPNPPQWHIDTGNLVRLVPAQPAQEPPSEWAGIKAILDEYGLQAIDFVADFKAALAQPAQKEAIYGMNQDDWKDVVAAITKVRDGRGIYLGCRPADVFQEWFLALGTAKVKEKNT